MTTSYLVVAICFQHTTTGEAGGAYWGPVSGGRALALLGISVVYVILAKVRLENRNELCEILANISKKG